jgi:anti-anti-sigma factor
MEITRQKSGDLLVLRLVGRLDANWCNHVQNALAAAVRDGEHRIHLDMAEVGYVSSAGLRVLLSVYKQLRAINGLFGVARASPAVRSVLELAGLDMLIAADTDATAAPAELGEPHASPSARYELFRKTTPFAGVQLEALGHAGLLRTGADPAQVPAREFGVNAFALGVGALGGSYADCAPRFGEFLAVAGVAAFQPSDGSSRPDFVVSQNALVPEGRLMVGLAGEGAFPLLARFEATPEARTVGLAELAATALALSGAPATVFAGVTETCGLVGAALRQSPAATGAADTRFGFPQIRDWLSFTSERAYRDSTSLVVGVVAQTGSPFDALLRPLRSAAPNSQPPTLSSQLSVHAHIHAAAFPYRPLRKGRIELKTAVHELFDQSSLQAVLHLLADPREFNGAGDSEFYRGALWIAPVAAP